MLMLLMWWLLGDAGVGDDNLVIADDNVCCFCIK